MTEIDHLTEDPVLPNQKFVCISFLSPEGVKNCSLRAVKIRGSYSTYKEAKKRAEELHRVDPDFHVFVGEVGKWLPWDPDPDSIENQEYGDKNLNDLMYKYKKNREKGRKIAEQRKQDMIRKAAREEQQKKRATIRAKRKKKTPVIEEDAIIPDDPEESKEIIKTESQNIMQTEEDINKKKEEISKLNSNLSRIKKLYDKLQNKK